MARTRDSACRVGTVTRIPDGVYLSLSISILASSKEDEVDHDPENHKDETDDDIDHNLVDHLLACDGTNRSSCCANNNE